MKLIFIKPIHIGEVEKDVQEELIAEKLESSSSSEDEKDQDSVSQNLVSALFTIFRILLTFL